jgi:membrane-bound serine protease (ClpP class)
MGEFFSILIYLLGLGLLFLELFVPTGGILAVAGVLCTGYGILQVFSFSVWAGFLIVLVTAAYLYVIIRFWGKRIRSTADLAGSDSVTPEASPTDVVGKEGVTLTILRPAGFAMVGDRRLQVVTDGSYLPKGQKIRVVDVIGNRIVVTKVEEERDLGDEAL